MRGLSLDRRDPHNVDALGGTFLRAISIDVRQPYYNDNADFACGDLVVAPTPVTLERIARLGGLWRPRPDGGDIVVSTVLTSAFGELMATLNADPAAGARHLRDQLFWPPLMFTVDIGRPNFLNVTDVPAGFGVGGKTLCLSNRHSRGDDGHAPSGPVAEATIAPAWERSITLHVAQEHSDDPPQDAAAVAWRKLVPADARSRAWWWEAEAARFLEEAARQAAESRSRRLPFALLELYVSAPADEPGPGPGSVYPIGMTASSSAPEEDGLTPVRYRLAFDAKATRWRYIVETRGGAVAADTLKISASAETAVTFAQEKDLTPAPLERGQAALAFLSDREIPLERRPTTSFYLEGTAGRRSAVKLIDPLPAPEPDALWHRRPPGEGDVSEIYVFV